jgi:phosphate transport system permease protein
MDKINKKIKKIDWRRKAFKKLMKRKRIYGRIEFSLAKRLRDERRFAAYGKISVSIALIFLSILFFNIISKGYTAFIQTQILLPVTVQAEDLKNDNYQKILITALQDLFPDSSNNIRKLLPLLSNSAPAKLKEVPPDGVRHEVWLQASSAVDMFNKSNLKNKLSDSQVAWIKVLDDKGRIRRVFNTGFFTSGDSRDPERAGILGSFVGSILVIMCCMLLAFPLGTMTAIYLEEFARKNKFTDFIELNINNLAAVPSIIYGLLGLTVYLQFMGVPRSAPLAGGLTLALMALPVIVIATRTSIRAIPQGIRDGALALGASRLQVTMHHVLPLAMPGIMTGTILSIARVMGETAPLLMIGMMAFIVNIPDGILAPATAMPVQIYLWSDSAEHGFIEKTSAAIIILLVLLAAINAVAVYLRKKFEVRW